VGPEQRGPFVNHRKTLKSLIINNKSNSEFLENLQKTIKNEVVGAQFGAQMIINLVNKTSSFRCRIGRINKYQLFYFFTG